MTLADGRAVHIRAAVLHDVPAIEALIDACEARAREAGFTRLELVATLSGVDFYARKGYHPVETLHYRMGDGSLIDFVRMEKPGGTIS